jgi:4-hydroxy-tetrahydrodipicolinate reductase
MGRAIESRALARGHACVAVFDSPAAGESAVGRFPTERLRGAEIAFEFSAPAAAERNVIELLGAGVGVVCGTTGWEPGPDLAAALSRATAGVVLAPNFSVGMNLFFDLVERAARLAAPLGGYEPAVFEAHHRGKLDVPSGTARKLARILVDADPRLECIVEGHPTGRLPERAVQIVGLRAGWEPGTHRVVLDGEHDRIVLEHGARGRDGFAEGAVLAAEWLCGRRGMHGFDSVLADLTARSS